MRRNSLHSWLPRSIAYGPTSSHTLNELLDSHIDHLEHRGREARTIEGYCSIAVQVAKDLMGCQPVARISVKAIDDFYLRLKRRGLSPGSIQRYHSLLRAAFRQAMAWDWVTRNPVQLATPPTAQRVGRRDPAVRCCRGDHRREGLNSRNTTNGVALRLLAATGARRGEVCGIRWNDVDLDRRVIRIRSVIAQLIDGSLVEKEPKGHQQREVTVDPTTSGPASPAPDRTGRHHHSPRPSTQLRRLCPRRPRRGRLRRRSRRTD